MRMILSTSRMILSASRIVLDDQCSPIECNSSINCINRAVLVSMSIKPDSNAYFKPEELSRWQRVTCDGALHCVSEYCIIAIMNAYVYWHYCQNYVCMQRASSWAPKNKCCSPPAPSSTPRSSRTQCRQRSTIFLLAWDNWFVKNKLHTIFTCLHSSLAAVSTHLAPPRRTLRFLAPVSHEICKTSH